MNSYSSNQLPHPKQLQNLAFAAKNFQGNNLLHQLVLDHSGWNSPDSDSNYINWVLKSMSNVPVNELNGEGYSALHLAVLKHNLLIVKKLLSYLVDIDVNTKCGFGKDHNTALHIAAKEGHFDIVQELLHKGANTKIKNLQYCTALCLAARSGNMDMIKLLVVNNSAAVYAKDEQNGHLYYRTPLYQAVKIGSLEIVQFLVNNGADVNVGDADEYMEFLLRIGVEDEEMKYTPLHHAVTCDMGSLEIVQFLVSKGAHVNAKDHNDFTSLHYAVGRGGLEIVRFLVNNGADVNARNEENGCTPLNLAVSEGRLEIVQFLVNNGADVNVLSLHQAMVNLCRAMKLRSNEAVLCSCFEIVEVLVKNSAHIGPLWILCQRVLTFHRSWIVLQLFSGFVIDIIF